MQKRILNYFEWMSINEGVDSYTGIKSEEEIEVSGEKKKLKGYDVFLSNLGSYTGGETEDWYNESKSKIEDDNKERLEEAMDKANKASDQKEKDKIMAEVKAKNAKALADLDTEWEKRIAKQKPYLSEHKVGEKEVPRPNPAKFIGIADKPPGNYASQFYTPGGDDGDWGGSAIRALILAKMAIKNSGVQEGKNAWIGSQKRDSTLVKGSSGKSNHHFGNKNAYAVDIPVTDLATGDKIFKALVDYFDPNGDCDVKSGSFKHYQKFPGQFQDKKDWNLKEVKEPKPGEDEKYDTESYNYTYQFLWRVENHYDHIHIGVANNGPVGESTAVPSPDDETGDKEWKESRPEEFIPAPGEGQTETEATKTREELAARLKKGGNIAKDEELYKQFKGFLQRMDAQTPKEES